MFNERGLCIWYGLLVIVTVTLCFLYNQYLLSWICTARSNTESYDKIDNIVTLITFYTWYILHLVYFTHGVFYTWYILHKLYFAHGIFLHGTWYILYMVYFYMVHWYFVHVILWWFLCLLGIYTYVDVDKREGNMPPIPSLYPHISILARIY